MDLTGIGNVADLAKGIMDRFIPPKATEMERFAVETQLQEMLQKRESALLDTQKSVIVAEMSQEDKFTKRARPTVVYSGLIFIFLVHVFIPLISFVFQKPMPNLALPTDFWYAWSGVVGVWMVGRSAEKLGSVNSLVSKITGGK